MRKMKSRDEILKDTKNLSGSLKQKQPEEISILIVIAGGSRIFSIGTGLLKIFEISKNTINAKNIYI